MQAYYNWAIAISDRARMRGRTKEAEDLWKQVQNLSFYMINYFVPTYVTVCYAVCICHRLLILSIGCG